MLLAIFMATALTRASVGLDVSRNDVAEKRALQTAKSGMEVAIYRANGLGLDVNQVLNPAQQCILNVNVLEISALPSGWNWCPPVSEDLGTGAAFTYRVSSVVRTTLSGGGSTGLTTYLLEREVVASGTVDGVTRRVYGKFTTQGGRSRNLVGSLLSVTCVIPALCINAVTSGFLQVYRLEPGSFRECSPIVVPNHPTDPKTGC